MQPDVLGGAGLGQLLCAPLRGLWGSCNGSGPHGRAVSPPTQRTYNLTHGNSQRHREAHVTLKDRPHKSHAGKPFATRAHTHTHRCPSLQTLVSAQTHLYQRQGTCSSPTHTSHPTLTQGVTSQPGGLGRPNGGGQWPQSKGLRWIPPDVKSHDAHRVHTHRGHARLCTSSPIPTHASPIPGALEDETPPSRPGPP